MNSLRLQQRWLNQTEDGEKDAQVMRLETNFRFTLAYFDSRNNTKNRNPTSLESDAGIERQL